MSEIIHGFEIHRHADISTCHVTQEDAKRIEELGQKIPGVISVYPEGWWIYLPRMEDSDEKICHLDDLIAAGMSKPYVTVIAALYIADIHYARFDADGAQHPALPQFEW